MFYFARMRHVALDDLAPSLRGLSENVSSVLRQTHGAAGDVSDEDVRWLLEQSIRTQASLAISRRDGCDLDLDHEPNAGQLNGGTHEDLEGK